MTFYFKNIPDISFSIFNPWANLFFQSKQANSSVRCYAIIPTEKAKTDKQTNGSTKSLSTLSQKSATVAEFRRYLAAFGDSRTFLRQCGQGFKHRLTLWVKIKGI